jgi:hypothetical protein
VSGPVAGEVQIILSLNQASYSQAIDEAYRNLDKLAGKSKQAGHTTVSSMQAASGALRELNGDFTNNIRAVERFITTVPGVGSALKAAFPLIGLAAFTGMLVEMGLKMSAAIKQAREMPEKLQLGFRGMNDASQLANDQLRVVNDSLEIQLNKLKGTPENNLKVALHESWVEADKLSKALSEDYSKVKDLLAQNKVSFTSSMASQINAGWGQDSTDDVTGTVDYYNRKIAGAAFDKNGPSTLAIRLALQSISRRWTRRL